MSSYRKATNEAEMKEMLEIRLKRRLTVDEYYIACIARSFGEDQEFKRISEKMIDNITYKEGDNE